MFGVLLGVILFIVCFSPKDDCTQLTGYAIENADSTINVAAYSFTDDEIADQLLWAKRRGVKIRIILDDQQAGNKNSIINHYSLKDFQMCVEKKRGLMHNKFIIIDNDIVLTGSYNFTNNAQNVNKENLIFIADTTLARIYKEEFERLWLEYNCQE